jgi:hypothetical protein
MCTGQKILCKNFEFQNTKLCYLSAALFVLSNETLNPNDRRDSLKKDGWLLLHNF